MKNNERLGKKAFSCHRSIEQNEKLRRILLIKNITSLVDMLDKEYYKVILGDEQAEWAGYLAQLEIFYSRNQVHTYTKIYKYLTQNLNIDPEKWFEVPITRLSECLPFVNKKNYRSWFDKANILTGQDWQIEIRKEKGLITEEDEHKCDMVEYEQCRICGVKHQK